MPITANSERRSRRPNECAGYDSTSLRTGDRYSAVLKSDLVSFELWLAI